jgi:hypothetical protein
MTLAVTTIRGSLFHRCSILDVVEKNLAAPEGEVSAPRSQRRQSNHWALLTFLCLLEFSSIIASEGQFQPDWGQEAILSGCLILNSAQLMIELYLG